jgi:predicted DCC family thiol-disulfide oxidoreductase YuxK
MSERWTGGQYSLYRMLLGAFLITHFVMLIPHGAEVFGAGGLIAAAELSPYIGVVPNPLAWLDSPLAITAWLCLGVLCGCALAIGWFDRIAAIFAALLLGWLFQRNPLIANPSLPLLGWLLVLHAFVPPRPFGSVAAVRAGGFDAAWRLPRHLHVAAWIVLALAYSHSGYTKLFSPSWVEGETIRLVLENPLARDHALRTWVLALPPIFLQLLTWGVLWVALLFAPLALFQRLRPLLWLLMLATQAGFLLFLNFADLTFPMLLAHLLTLDPRWLRRWVPKTDAVLLFDGECALCNGCVQLAIAEERNGKLRFAPLDSEVGVRLLERVQRDWRGDAIVLLQGQRTLSKSRAVAAVLEYCGGSWFLLGRLLQWVPRVIADAGYDLVGHLRYRVVGRATACAILPASRMARSLQIDAPLR